MSFFKGMAAGIAVGSVLGMVAAPKRRKLRFGKALRTVGNAVDTVAGSIGL